MFCILVVLLLASSVQSLCPLLLFCPLSCSQDHWTALMKACERGHSECARVILSHPSANPNKHDKVLLLIIETRSLFMQCYFPNIVALACVRLLNVNITGTGPPHGADNSGVQRLYRGGASHPVRQGSESQHARQGTCIFFLLLALPLSCSFVCYNLLA